ncbi:hypothetical protein FTV88_2609 [Heliorestis convoluta]|uniref:Uncharacterized protein n=1 Tax=Heliorestis convoluta TaxID=356322 RepID=A0A5Q2N5T3_9FIRM|nr:hypothetical protein FTV88_2609 [Heliorestis convoluta]
MFEPPLQLHYRLFHLLVWPKRCYCNRKEEGKIGHYSTLLGIKMKKKTS